MIDGSVQLPRVPARHVLAAALFGLVVGSCGSPEPGPVVVPLVCPAPPGSAEPHLVSRGDSLAASWLVHHANGTHSFQYALLSDGSWGAVRTIRTAGDFFANWADRPSVLPLDDGTWVAHWLQKSGPDTYAYDVRLAPSADGRSWGAPITPHDDGTQTEHGFVSLVPSGQDGVLAVWLDGRETAGKEHEHAEMTLRAAHWSPQGLSHQALLDARVCDCCPTSAVQTDRGVLVAYRDRDANETRDISLVRFEDGTWSDPWPLHEDGWIIQGCPVNGPALAAREARVAAAWYTEAGGAKLFVGLSSDAGSTFPHTVRVDDGHPAGRADIVLLDDGDVLVIWLEAPPEGLAEIRGRRIGERGNADPAFTIASTGGGRGSGYPRLARFGGSVVVAWTQTSEPPRIRMATLTGLR